MIETSMILKDETIRVACQMNEPRDARAQIVVKYFRESQNVPLSQAGSKVCTLLVRNPLLLQCRRFYSSYGPADDPKLPKEKNDENNGGVKNTDERVADTVARFGNEPYIVCCGLSSR